MPKNHINVITRDSFESLPVDNKLDILFDLLTDVRIDNKERCTQCEKRLEKCDEEFDEIKSKLLNKDEIKLLISDMTKEEFIELIKKETKMSLQTLITYISLIFLGSAIGGMFAHWLGIESMNLFHNFRNMM